MTFDFLAGGGEMGERMRDFDWSRTELGPALSWPNSLRTALSIVLGSRYPMFVWWGKALVNFYNDAYIPVLGKRHPQALGRPAREVWSEIWDVLGPQAEVVLKTGRATWNDRQLLVMERNGYTEETYFSWSYSPVTDESGAVNGVFCACTEDTARVLGERRLQTLSDLGARTAEGRDAYAACHKAAAEIGKNPKDIPFAAIYLLEERSQARFAAGVRVEPHEALFPRTLELDCPHWPLAEVAASGQARWVQTVSALKRIPAVPWPEAVEQAVVLPIAAAGEERPTGFLIAGISPRRVLDGDYRKFLDLVAGHLAKTLADARAYEAEKRRAEALAEIDRAKTAFFSNVSHEFRTPLTLILGPVEDGLADAEAPLAPAQRERLQLARRSGLRLQKLVNTLLEFSRIEAGRAQASYAPVDLAALTADLASSFRSAVEKAGLGLAVDCPPPGEPAYVDRDMWEKIVFNLLSNAFKFTFEGAIAVSLKRAQGRFELAVRDTGIGIPAAELPHVFDRFRRVEGARSRTHEGTGIGLALVQELARLHGGSVRAESVEGKGSTFTVSLLAGRAHLPAERISVAPVRSPTRGAEPYLEEALSWLAGVEAAPEPQPARGRRERIVWADDNADMREYVRRLLSPRYDVEAVATGEAALAAVRARRPDLVLADVMMPGLDGLGLTRALRADAQIRSIPVILLSARAGEEARIEGLDAGADDYLCKPFGARELLAQVAARLDLSRLQARLQQERADLANLFQQTPVPTAVLRGSELVFEMANPAYLAVVGGRPVVGKPMLEALPEAQGQGFEELLRQVMRTGKPHIGHETLVRLERDGEVQDRYFTFIYAPLRGEGGVVERVIAIVNEVTEQVRAREKLRERDERLRLAMAAGLMGAWDIDLASGAVTWDAKQCELFGRPSTQPARTMDEFYAAIHPGDVQRLQESAALATGAGRFADEFRIVRPDGDVRWIAGIGATVNDARGNPVRMVGVNYDVTERKRAEQALKDADRRKDEFIATLSHELRNPLAPLRHALDVLRLSGVGGASATTLEIMERQVKHLARLVDDLLEMSRITRGAFELRRERLPVSAVVAHAVETSEPSIRAARHRLALSLPGETLWVDGDAVRLAQILANLLDNAAKYTPAGGEISVSARHDGGAIEVVVSDSGEGISAEALPRLFEMFSRGGRASGGGLGIGLALARHLAQMHGGTLQARSDGLGKGAQFILRLPAVEAGPAQTASMRSGEEDLPQRRVLVVDDNRDAAESLGTVLELLGAQVRLAHAGPEAIEAVAAYRPSVVLLDLGMPGMDGYEVARRLRARQGGTPLSIVALTGWGQDEDRRRTLEAGFDHHLVKPADIEQLQSLLASLR